MKFRPTPPAATWFLKRFGPKPESETVIGDLYEQYQFGRSRIWYWQQVLAIVFLRFYRRVPDALASKAGILLEHAWALLLVSALLIAIVVAPFRLFLIIGAGMGVLAGILKHAWDEQHDAPSRTDPLSIAAIDTPMIHMSRDAGTWTPSVQHAPVRPDSTPLPRIDSSKIPIAGGMGAGILILILLTGALHDLPLLRVMAIPGILAGLVLAAVLRYWRRSHEPKSPLVLLSLTNHKK
jgi:hypothetical protein